MPRFAQICPCVCLCMEGGAQRTDGSMCKGENPCENATCVGEEQAGLRAGRTAWCERVRETGKAMYGVEGEGQNRTLQRGGKQQRWR